MDNVDVCVCGCSKDVPEEEAVDEEEDTGTRAVPSALTRTDAEAVTDAALETMRQQVRVLSRPHNIRSCACADLRCSCIVPVCFSLCVWVCACVHVCVCASLSLSIALPPPPQVSECEALLSSTHPSTEEVTSLQSRLRAAAGTLEWQRATLASQAHTITALTHRGAVDPETEWALAQRAKAAAGREARADAVKREALAQVQQATQAAADMQVCVLRW